jgi:transcriptional regulator with PAS, ATPase and Fis domain
MHLLGDSPAIRDLRVEAAEAARSDAKVLITGESGVGKEVVAHLIHSDSSRSSAPLVTLNCAGVPDSLLESELFGHVRGSFTGAYRDRPGHLEMAQRGTIFLDEVGEMSLRMQALLLRFLESGEIQRVGGEAKPSRMDVRVIAATNRDIREQIALGAFRLDLFYRINVIHLHIPPLRDRREDIPLLLRHFMSTYCDRYGVQMPAIDEAVLRRFTEYGWPGNVRELKNVAERLALRWKTGTVAFADLPPELLGRLASAGRQTQTSPVTYKRDLIVERMLTGGETFWDAAYLPFMSRDLTREDLRYIVGAGLQMTQGSYKRLAQLFNMPAADYKRFLNFLRKHGCQLPFQQYRGVLVEANDSSK